MIVSTTAIVVNVCTISEEDEAKIRENAANLIDDFDYIEDEEEREKEALLESLRDLYARGEINLYENSQEVDFDTQDFFDLQINK